jgi:hypothetical protein
LCRYDSANVNSYANAPVHPEYLWSTMIGDVKSQRILEVGGGCVQAESSRISWPSLNDAQPSISAAEYEAALSFIPLV